MQAGQFKMLMNPYEWLPPEGEIRTFLQLEGGELQIEVIYEEADTGVEKSKSLRFSGTCSFTLSLVPGVSLSTLEYKNVALSGHLVEFEESEAAKSWTDYLKYRQVRHYQIYFLSEKRLLEVFAGAWHL